MATGSGGDPSEVFKTSGGPVTREQIRERCSVVEPGIVLVRHLQVGTVHTFGVLMERAAELGEPFGAYARW
jgi:hypothetical protein